MSDAPKSDAPMSNASKSDAPPVADSPPSVQPYYYQILCAVALAAIFLVQLQQGLLVPALLGVCLGAMSILVRTWSTPFPVLLNVVGWQLYVQYQFPAAGPRRLLQVEDVLLCVAALAYVSGHYRLQSLWQSIVPIDPRQRYHRRAPV